MLIRVITNNFFKVTLAPMILTAQKKKRSPKVIATRFKGEVAIMFVSIE